MNIIYKKSVSNEKPLEIDITSCPDGVYIRRDIKTVVIEQEESDAITRFEYQEAFLTKDEYETYANNLIADKVNGNDNSQAFENYKAKLDTGILYSNGKSYKPRYYEDYGKIMSEIKDVMELKQSTGGSVDNLLTQTFAVYDETGLVVNMVEMTISEVIDLYFFLYAKKEQYFTEYKFEKTN